MGNINIEDLFKLPVEVRLELVHDLWDSIASDTGVLPLTDEDRAILDQRLASYSQEPKAGSSWEEVKARLAKR